VRVACQKIVVLAFAWSLVTLACISAHAGEPDALAISANIQALHLPYGTILDPIYASADSNQIVGYTRCGDSAIWTGHYLAAEAFRFKVTQSPDASKNVRNAIAGIKSLADVTGNNLLARCLVPMDSPFAAGIQSEEAHNGIYTNSSAGYIWVGHTSRDQYSGVIFGLGVAYDMVDDPAVKSSISDLVSRLIEFLTGHAWNVVMPDGSISTSFLARPDQMLAFVQIGKHVNPSRFSSYYDELRNLLLGTVRAPIAVEVQDDGSYFKFNLDYINFFNLIRLESGSAAAVYKSSYSLLRNHTSGHQNAFFNVIDRALGGANDAARDSDTLRFLDEWLLRPRRDPYVDLTGTVPVCGEQACQPVSVSLRPPTDFLWQRNPFQLTGGGSGTIETAGIDYILPYWMARYYGLYAAFVVQSAAATSSAVAPGSIGSLYGSNLAIATEQASGLPLPTSLGGISLTITDAAGTQNSAPLGYVSTGQVNFVVPDGTVPGPATFTISGGPATSTATGMIQNVAPTLFSASGNGMGVAAATAVRTQALNPQSQSHVPIFQCDNSGCVSVPINLGVDTPVYLTLYGTAIRNRSSLSNVMVTINGFSVPVLYAGPQADFTGLDQVNVLLTLNLRGSGESNVVLTVDGQTANTVTVNIQ